jgi:C-terminal processing protease CtpA/Prc
MTQWTRRRALRVAAGLSVASLVPAALTRIAWAKDPPKGDAYAKDVDFLLDTLGKKAAALLKLKGVAWDAVEKEFRAAARAVTSDGEHLRLCARLVARLRDGHAGLRDLKVPWPDETGGKRSSGPGVFLVVVGAKVHVRQAWAQAAQEDLASGQEVLSIDGRPARAWLDAKVAEMRDTTGYSTDHQALYAACHWGMAGPEGSKMAFKFAAGGKTKSAEVTRRDASVVPSGPVFPPKGLTAIGRQSYGKTAGGFGYVHLRDVPGELPDQLDTALDAIGDVPGLVLDCRANGGGGCDHAAVFARFLPEGKAFGPYKGAGKRPFAGPMVVIVDAGIRSAGETVAGQFKEDGRAYMIGDTPTAGMSSQKETVTVPSGMFSVLFSVASHGRNFNGGRGIEGIGVPPHELTPYEPADLAKGVDTQIRRAEELLAKGFPKGAVRWG